MENLESRLKNAPCFCCEKENSSASVCQTCGTCVLAWKITSTREWFGRVGELSRTRFLVSILERLDGLRLLHYFQNLLQATLGKDVTYARSRVYLSKKEGKTRKPFWSQALDEAVGQRMRELLSWFGASPWRTKAGYTLLLLQMCDPRLLLTAAHVIRVLIQREWGSIPEERRKPSLQHVSEMKQLLSGHAGWAEAGHAPSDLLMGLDAVRDLSSGASQAWDFIRHLPVHLSKYILSLLDKNTLTRCASVSQHWAALTQQVKLDLSMRASIQNQVALWQGSYSRGFDPTFASKLLIPVPKVTDDRKRLRVKSQKGKLRMKNDYNLWTAYQNQETQQVLMEERNVFCGKYNIHVLSDTWDRNRVMHYSGGRLVAVSSNRKIQLLDILRVDKVPTHFRGHTGPVRSLFLCEDGNFLLSGSHDLSIRYWDLKSGACIRIFNGHRGTITCMDLYKNRLVSGAKDCHAKEWDVNTGKCLKTFKHKDAILATRINDTYIVSSCERGVIKVWHVLTAQLVKMLSGHEGAVKCLCLDPWHLLSGSADGLVMAWSMVGKYERCLMAFKHPKEVLHVALVFLRVISACADGKIRIYNFLNGNCLKVLKASSRGDPVLSFFIQGDRMLLNTERSIVLFQFEPVQWQYSMEPAKQKTKVKVGLLEPRSLTKVLSQASTPAFGLGDPLPSKHIVAQESQLSRPQWSRVLLRAAVSRESPQGQGKSRSPQKDGKKRASPVPKEASSVDDDVEKVQKQGDLETPGDLTSHSKKKSWQIPMSPDRFLLTISALQQAHNSGQFAYPQRPQTQVVDARGPLIPYPRKVLSFKGKAVQPAVDRLRISNPPTDVKWINIPLEIRKLRPNLKSSLQSPGVQSSLPQPMIIRPRLSGSSKAHGAGHSFSPLTSMQVIKPHHMLVPPVGGASQTLKREPPCFYTSLNPFRVNTEFVLLTVKEQKEYGEAKMREFQATAPTGAVSPEKASKAAWIRKIKGLPIDDFMKQGKTAAPELGPNVYI